LRAELVEWLILYPLKISASIDDDGSRLSSISSTKALDRYGK